MTKPTAQPLQQKPRGVGATLLWCTYLTCIIVLSLGASWATLKQVDFGYPMLHDLLNIDRVIQQYAPNNRYRDHFEQTSPAEQKRLFHEIVIAIHDDPERLKRITYHATDGTPLGKLLREPEITHLEDVKDLVDRFFVLCASLLPLAAVMFWVLQRYKIPFPGTKKIAKVLLIVIILITAVIIIIGPTAVFYQLHIWLFPPTNQWFFYYYESLMTTLMVAPIIFGPIAIFLVLTALPYIFAVLMLTRILLSSTQK
jgi:hypothetical protein